MMTPKDLAEIEARAKAATEGPWWTYANPMRSDGVFIGAGERQEEWPKGYLVPQMRVKPERRVGLSQVSHADGAFITHARQDIPDLIAEVRRLRALYKQSKSFGDNEPKDEMTQVGPWP